MSNTKQKLLLTLRKRASAAWRLFSITLPQKWGLFWRTSKTIAIGEPAKNIASLTKDILTIVSILLAGWWFLTKGELLLARIALQPKIDVETTCTVLRVHPKRCLLDIAVKLQNKSSVVAKLDAIDVSVHQVLPLRTEIQERIDRDYSIFVEGQDFVDWEPVARQPSQRSVVLNPGETDSEHFEVEVPASTKLVRIRAYVPSADGIGWRSVSYQNLETTKLDENAPKIP